MNVEYINGKFDALAIAEHQTDKSIRSELVEYMFGTFLESLRSKSTLSNKLSNHLINMHGNKNEVLNYINLLKKGVGEFELESTLLTYSRRHQCEVILLKGTTFISYGFEYKTYDINNLYFIKWDNGHFIKTEPVDNWMISHIINDRKGCNKGDERKIQELEKRAKDAEQRAKDAEQRAQNLDNELMKVMLKLSKLDISNNSHTKEIKMRKIAFRWNMGADFVAIKGSWDGWQGTTSLKIVKNKFQIHLSLSPGDYEYKYIVNGEYVLDHTKPIKNNNNFIHVF